MSVERDDARWPVWRITLLLYPFGMAAVAVNLFMLGLLGHAIGLPALSPVWALVLSGPLGVPATLGFATRIRTLMDEADDGRGD